jgi:predicted DNA-binding transcriptional regulator AlpA
MVDELEPGPVDAVVGIRQVALMCGVSAKTVSRWLSCGRFPPPVQAVPRGRLRWKRSVIERWLESRLRTARTDQLD